MDVQDLDELRRTKMPAKPWPSNDGNPMFCYLLERAVDIAVDGDSVRESLIWLAAHCWFEGALEARADIVRAARSTTRQ